MNIFIRRRGGSVEAMGSTDYVAGVVGPSVGALPSVADGEELILTEAEWPEPEVETAEEVKEKVRVFVESWRDAGSAEYPLDAALRAVLEDLERKVLGVDVG